MLIQLALGFLTGVATAAEAIVLYDTGTEDEVRAFVVDESKRSPADLSLTQYAAFRASLTPRWSGGGTLSGCEADLVTNRTVSEGVGKAERALIYLKLDEATAALASARAHLPCLEEPAPTATVARLGLLQGVISVENGDKAAAFTQFNWASRFDSQLLWDDQYPPDGKALLTVAQQELATSEEVPVRLAAPLGADEALWLNGTRVEGGVDTLGLVPGEQLIQVRGAEGMDGYTVVVEPSTKPTLLLPQLLPGELNWATHDAGQAKLSEVFSSIYDADTAVFVAKSEGLWRTHVGTPDWVELVAPARKAVAKSLGPLPTMAWVGAGATSMVAASTLVMLGSTLAGGGRIQTQRDRFVGASGRGAIGEAETAYWAESDLRKKRVQTLVGTGIGAALTTVGVVYTVPLFKRGH